MPFQSKAQEAWAFANHQKFAKKWAAMTDQKDLPGKVKAYHKKVIKHLIVSKKKNKYSEGLRGY